MTRTAPWTDFAGAPIHEGATIRHPSGETGTVVYLQGPFEHPGDHWRVDYHDGGPVARLGLQIGSKGMAQVVSTELAPNRKLAARLSPQ